MILFGISGYLKMKKLSLSQLWALIADVRWIFYNHYELHGSSGSPGIHGRPPLFTSSEGLQVYTGWTKERTEEYLEALKENGFAFTYRFLEDVYYCPIHDLVPQSPSLVDFVDKNQQYRKEKLELEMPFEEGVLECLRVSCYLKSLLREIGQMGDFTNVVENPFRRSIFLVQYSPILGILQVRVRANDGETAQRALDVVLEKFPKFLQTE